jgi:hypothetical protein
VESGRNFRKAVDRDLDRSVVDGTRREDNINDQVEDLERATDRLRDASPPLATCRRPRRPARRRPPRLAA